MPTMRVKTPSAKHKAIVQHGAHEETVVRSLVRDDYRNKLITILIYYGKNAKLIGHLTLAMWRWMRFSSAPT